MSEVEVRLGASLGLMYVTICRKVTSTKRGRIGARRYSRLLPGHSYSDVL